MDPAREGGEAGGSDEGGDDLLGDEQNERGIDVVAEEHDGDRHSFGIIVLTDGLRTGEGANHEIGDRFPDGISSGPRQKGGGAEGENALGHSTGGG